MNKSILLILIVLVIGSCTRFRNLDGIWYMTLTDQDDVFGFSSIPLLDIQGDSVLLIVVGDNSRGGLPEISCHSFDIDSLYDIGMVYEGDSIVIANIPWQSRGKAIPLQKR